MKNTFPCRNPAEFETAMAKVRELVLSNERVVIEPGNDKPEIVILSGDEAPDEKQAEDVAGDVNEFPAPRGWDHVETLGE